MSAKIIQLFRGDAPPTQDSEFWEWGKTFVEDGVTTLELIVDEINTCETEEHLKRVLTELKDEVGKIPLD